MKHRFFIRFTFETGKRSRHSSIFLTLPADQFKTEGGILAVSDLLHLIVTKATKDSISIGQVDDLGEVTTPTEEPIN